MNYILTVKLGQELGTTIMLQYMFAIFTWLAHWYSRINAFRSPYGVERKKDHLPIATFV
jgi:hypothetical protein